MLKKEAVHNLIKEVLIEKNEYRKKVIGSFVT
jgi:hypothetical protein